ncbi:hypothetical protein, partial [Pyramidobacter piscolens]|uniref:hypothetical protein n=1 Tax=Pyramidobacter piscolens TaxID=638849 RepID=UPI003AB5D1A2
AFSSYSFSKLLLERFFCALLDFGFASGGRSLFGSFLVASPFPLRPCRRLFEKQIPSQKQDLTHGHYS